MNKKLAFIFVLIAILSFSLSAAAQAQTSSSDMEWIQYDVQADKLDVLLNTKLEAEVSRASAVLSDTPLPDTSFQKLADSQTPVTFLVLIDTSVSYNETVNAAAGEIIKTIYTERNSNQDEKDNYIIMTFGKRGLTSGPVKNPIPSLDDIKFNSPDRESDYFAALSDAVDYLQDRSKNGNQEKQLILLITDGFESSTSYITESKLKTKLHDAHIPLYTLTQYNNAASYQFQSCADQMKDFADQTLGAAFARKASNYDLNTPARGILEDLNHCYLISSDIPASFPVKEDGQYQLSLVLNSADGMELTSARRSFSAEITHPSICKGEDCGKEATPCEGEDCVKPEPVQQDLPWYERSVTLPGTNVTIKMLYLFFSALILLILVLILMLRRSSKNKGEEELGEDGVPENDLPPESASVLVDNSGLPSEAFSVPLPENPLPAGENFSKPEVIQKPKKSNSGQTEVYETHGNGNGNGDVVQIILESPVENPIRTALAGGETKYFGRIDGEDDKGNHIIGLSGNRKISGKHFSLTNDRGKIIIEDEGSTNGTYLKGKRINAKTRVNNGDILLAGETEYTIHMVN